MDFISIAKSYKKKLEREISFLEDRILQAPEGGLKVISNGNRYKWYLVDEKKERRYIPKKEENLAVSLAVKSHDKRLLIVLKKEKEAVDAYIFKYERRKNAVKNLLMDSEEFSRLISLGTKREDFVQKWISEEYEKNNNHPETLTVKTVNGLYVRSKSEAYIAAELASHSIPFRYECRKDIGGITFYPDFTILNPLNNEEIIWEHLGMMDDDNYLNAALNKLRIYIKAEYIPTVNLILTYETKDVPLDFSTVQDLIKMHFQV